MSPHRTPATHAAAASAPPRRAALAALALATLLASLGTSVANVALPTLARELGTPFMTAQWIVLAYLLAVTASVVAIGRLADALGRRRLLIAGLVTFTTASAASGLAPTVGALIAARAVQGLGAAAMMALAVALVAEVVPTSATGRAMGLLGTTSAVGTALGPSLGGVLIHALGWRSIFGVSAALGAVGAALARAALPPDATARRASAGPSELARTLLLAATLAAYALATTLGRGHLGAANAALAVASALGAALFVVTERRSATPLVRTAALGDPARRAGLAASGVVATVLMATLVVGPFYLAGALGLEARWVGVVMSAGPAVAALSAVPAGRIVDRFGTGRASAAGLAGIATGSVALTAAGARFGVAGFVVPIVVVTASYALFQTANNTAVMRGVSSLERGGVAGMLNLSRNLGLVTGTAVMGAIFALATGSHDPASAAPEALARGLRVTFGAAAALVAAALVGVTLPKAAGAAPARRERAGSARTPLQPALDAAPRVPVLPSARASAAHTPTAPIGSASSESP